MRQPVLQLLHLSCALGELRRRVKREEEESNQWVGECELAAAGYFSWGRVGEGGGGWGGVVT